MQYTAEQYHQTFAYATSSELVESVSLAEIEAQVNAVEASLLGMRAELSPVLQQSALVDLVYHYALMYVFEACLINPLVRRKRSNSTSHNTTILSTIILRRCLQAVRSFFEAFFTVPTSEYRFLSCHQWMAITYAIVLLYKLSLSLPYVPSWDVQIARSTVPLEDYLEQCCKSMNFAHRVASTPSDNNGAIRKDLYSLQAVIWNDVLMEYLRRKDLSLDQRSISSSNVVHRRALADSTEASRDVHELSDMAGNLMGLLDIHARFMRVGSRDL
jgi:hypothetical protein